jgi:hypothetical protein
LKDAGAGSSGVKKKEKKSEKNEKEPYECQVLY